MGASGRDHPGSLSMDERVCFRLVTAENKSERFVGPLWIVGFSELAGQSVRFHRTDTGDRHRCTLSRLSFGRIFSRPKQVTQPVLGRVDISYGFVNIVDETPRPSRSQTNRTPHDLSSVLI